MNHVLPDNTIYYLVSAPSFRGTAIVKQQVEEGGMEKEGTRYLQGRNTADVAGEV
jgi:hypothetical protein